MMKLSFLLAVGACALVINSKAETVDQQIGAAQESQARSAQRIASAMEVQTGALQAQASALQTQANVAVAQERREEAREWAEYQAALAQAKAEHEKWIQKMYRDQDLRNQARDAAFAEDAKSNPFYHTDALPLWNQYDSIMTIKVYLHDSGNDVSDTEASKVRSYMLAHGIKHVSQLAQ